MLGKHAAPGVPAEARLEIAVRLERAPRHLRALEHDLDVEVELRADIGPGDLSQPAQAGFGRREAAEGAIVDRADADPSSPSRVPTERPGPSVLPLDLAPTLAAPSRVDPGAPTLETPASGSGGAMASSTPAGPPAPPPASRSTSSATSPPSAAT